MNCEHNWITDSFTGRLRCNLCGRFKEYKAAGPHHIDDIIPILLAIFPEMEVGEDNDGQLVVYTGWEACSSDGFYAPIKIENKETK